MLREKPKLIEVALPLAAINAEAAREKSIRHGHPSTLHLWWARRPLAAARAVIWASLVDDPSGDPSLTPDEQDAERQRLFGILERLVKWEKSNNPDVLAEARAEIDRCFPDGPPPILDPFAGGGAIPLEAQRLGLTALAGDLNPVAVLINKAMIEIPPRFAGMPPVHPDIDKTLTTWERAQGLAADVEAYGQWMRDEAHKRIGHLYPRRHWLRRREAHAHRLDLGPHRGVARPELVRACAAGGIVDALEETRQAQGLDRADHRPRRHDDQLRDPRWRRAHPLSKTVTRGKGTCIATGRSYPGDYIKPRAAPGAWASSS